MSTRICPICQKKFYTVTSKKYCSQICTTINTKQQLSQWYEKNKKSEKQRKQIWNKDHPEYFCQWQQKNKKHRRDYAEQWYLYNKCYWNRYFKKRRHNDPNFKIRCYLGSRIWHALKGLSKSTKTLELVGCTIEELWRHLEKQFKPGMTKENYGLWHIDHIKPCCLFDLSDLEQQKACFHYSNLQPLWAEENFKKNGKMI